MLIYIDCLLAICLSFFIYYDVLLIAQQNHYHFNYLIKYYKKYLIKLDLLVYLIYIFKVLKISNLISNILTIFLIILVVIIIVNKISQKKVIPLKLTFRIKRNIVMIFIISLITILLLGTNFYILLAPLITLISFIILEPIERIINYKYIKKAKKKIKNIKPLIIGITGSAGKTSVKNFLYEIIKEEKITFASPKSYNTLMGLCKFINNEVTFGTEVLILEYGASKKGDISRLVKFIKPDIGILTNVLPQHIESFKSIENIKKEKEKLLKASRVSIYNYDILKIDDLDNLVIRVGSKNADLIVSDTVTSGFGSTFKINGINYKTELLGKCNLQNILLAIACSLYLEIDIKNIIKSVSSLKQVENRLEIKKVNNSKEVIIINDSFNSNIEGFKNALEVLSLFNKEKKVIITPGIVEAGKEENRLNTEVAVEIVKYNVDIYLIETNASKIIESVLSKNNIKFINFRSFKDAYQKALDEGFDVILIENDVGDIYLK